MLQRGSVVRIASDVRMVLQKAGLTKANRWDQFKDFKWLKSTPSPNWHVIPDSERTNVLL